MKINCESCGKIRDEKEMVWDHKEDRDVCVYCYSKLDEKIKRFESLCKRGYVRGLMPHENREFKRLEREISEAILKDDLMFDKYIKQFREILFIWVKERKKEEKCLK